MPKKSRHASHLLMIIGGTFAFLLLVTGIFTVKKRPYPSNLPSISGQKIAPQNGQVEGAATNESAPATALTDTSSWKTYQDPVYHFSLKYPSNWAKPTAQKINNTDFDYEYQVSFGTAETLAGQDFDGFDLFVFQTGKCDSSTIQSNGRNNSAGESTSNCSSSKSKVSAGLGAAQNILVFSSQAYTYSIAPLIPPDNADPNLVKNIKSEFDEAGKTFQFDSNLKVPSPPQNAAKPASAPTPPKPAPAVGKRGKLSGAVSSRGRLVCPHPNRKPTRSPNQGNHVDEDCCPDPDEWPNIACFYKPGDYKIMLKP